MLILEISIYIVVSFLGYLLGRAGHYYLVSWIMSLSKNPRFKKWGPHHWIYGLILIIIGLIIFENYLRLLLVSFGIGILVSDLKDLFQLKFVGLSAADKKKKKKFWAID